MCVHTSYVSWLFGDFVSKIMKICVTCPHAGLGEGGGLGVLWGLPKHCSTPGGAKIQILTRNCDESRRTTTNHGEPRRTLLKSPEIISKMFSGVLGDVLVGCWDHLGWLVALLWFAKI